MSGNELVHLQIDDATATITLDSPHNRNALSRQLVSELSGHLATADASDDARVIVLTHTGSTFCAGADLAEAVRDGMEQGARSFLDLLRAVVALETPVIAVVHGHVRAGGLGLVGACDLALVTSSSTFAFTESLLGLTPAVISLTTQSRLAERDAATKYLIGEAFGGDEAVRCGLVTEAVAPEDLDARVEVLLQACRRVSPQGLRETKALLNRRLLERIDTEGEALVAWSARLFASDEAQEGMTAFKDKRPPRWAADRHA